MEREYHKEHRYVPDWRHISNGFEIPTKYCSDHTYLSILTNSEAIGNYNAHKQKP